MPFSGECQLVIPFRMVDPMEAEGIIEGNTITFEVPTGTDLTNVRFQAIHQGTLSPDASNSVEQLYHCTIIPRTMSEHIPLYRLTILSYRIIGKSAFHLEDLANIFQFQFIGLVDRFVVGDESEGAEYIFFLDLLNSFCNNYIRHNYIDVIIS